MLSVLPAGGQSPESAIAQINALRDVEELSQVEPNPALDTLAARYVDAIIAARCVCPEAGGSDEADRLLDDVATALGHDDTWLDVGLVAGYDRSASGAITTTIHDPANAAAIRAQRMELAGIATRVIEPGESWLAPPVGRAGPEIDLTGFTLVVIILAGSAP